MQQVVFLEVGEKDSMADSGGGIRSVVSYPGMKNSDWRENLASESRQNILRRMWVVISGPLS